jgi:hypothetical protein
MGGIAMCTLADDDERTLGCVLRIVASTGYSSMGRTQGYHKYHKLHER